MSGFVFEVGETILFDNEYCQETEGQITDRWMDDDGAWYEVVDLFGNEGPLALHDDRLRAYL